MIELRQRVNLINRIHLFNGLKEDQLAGIAVKFEEREVPAGQVIFKRGDKPDGFYVVFKGKVNVTRPNEKKGDEEVIVWLVGGDYFGEEALVENRSRSATITAVEDSLLLFMPREHFHSLLTAYPKLKPNFLVAIKSHKLARATRFKWLGPKEIIYFVARRHKIRLYQALIPPVLSLLVPLGLFIAGIFLDMVTSKALAVISLVFIVGWAGWNALDWSNDYYIVTNQRVVWLEKVIGLYESREEAPLSTILSVGVETDQLGRIFDYGNVIVRTFVGRLEFDHVDHPHQAAEMIREYWERVKSVLTVSQQEVMRNAIREKLGLPVDKRKLDELPPIVTVDRNLQNLPLWWVAFITLFKLREEDAGKVIYHKHWIVLLHQTWKPLAVILGLFALQIWRLVFLWKSPVESALSFKDGFHPDGITFALPLLSIPFIVWLVWEYVDWKNDIFMVASDEIFDIDRKPFGKEEKRAAQIDSILSTSYTRNGIIQYLFNYGTVKIAVGGATFDFQDVADPASVQADINRRRAARIAKKKEDEGSADRERFATWIAAYHQNINDFNAPPKPPKESAPAAPQGDGADLDNLPIADDIEEQPGLEGGMMGGEG
ncbi:MAG: cyclic nucleotide-binding domain-containing protein [Chloroflexi bacterium]|nr:cyclic nucleotide-binding domain-containing protein [Chloroflexota bacterium]MCA2001892.1 cyclic nucleotide-binding domain-containing protein [Chloroflexota bacterium]